MTLNGFYLIFLYVCEYPRTILPHTNCMKNAADYSYVHIAHQSTPDHPGPQEQAL